MISNSSNTRGRWRRGSALSAALVVAILGGSAADVRAADDLYYHVEGDAVVITNVPSAEARPLPGWSVERKGRAPAATPGPYDPYIEMAAKEAGISPLLVKAVVGVESGFDARAVSPKGAQGLMQLMPETAREYGVSDAFDAWQNLRAGSRHLRGLIDRFGDLDLALAAYNAGAGAVSRHGGIPDYVETRNYVRKVRTALDPSGVPAATATVGRVRRDADASPVRMVQDAGGGWIMRN